MIARAAMFFRRALGAFQAHRVLSRAMHGGPHNVGGAEARPERRSK